MSTISSTRITDLPTDDKPREKALTHGVEHLTNTELIAIALGSGIPGKSVIELSREILAACNDDLGQLSRLSAKEMVRKFKGVGPAKAISLAAAIVLGSRCATARGGEMPTIRSAEDAYAIVRGEMQHLDHEEFRIIILSRANRVKSVEVISTGGTAATVVDIKILIKKAVDALADGIILVHNHPSGTLSPSRQDDNLTIKVKEAATLLDIRVLDHIIVGQTGFFSYQDNGRL